MSTLSVPINDDLREKMEFLVAQGLASNLAEIARTSLKKYLDEMAVKMVLEAKQQPSLSGDLDTLAKQL